MARRRHHEEEHENHERWLVSYADFITLLFAFFVVMYAISQVNLGKYRVLSDALVSAFQNRPSNDVRVIKSGDPARASNSYIKPYLMPRPATDPAREEEKQKMQGLASNLSVALDKLVQQGQVRVSQSKRGVVVEINASVLFQPAEANLSGESSRALRAIAQQLATVDNLVHIAGHTDNIPIRTPLYPSNWELSGARAASVIRLFAENGIDPARMTAMGYADTRPVTANLTPDDRARNRRVAVIILADNKDEAVVVADAAVTATTATRGN
jgi:chemotaxis protein MotB